MSPTMERFSSILVVIGGEPYDKEKGKGVISLIKIDPFPLVLPAANFHPDLSAVQVKLNRSRFSTAIQSPNRTEVIPLPGEYWPLTEQFDGYEQMAATWVSESKAR